MTLCWLADSGVSLVGQKWRFACEPIAALRWWSGSGVSLVVR